jgi:chitodextrinase
VLSVTSPSGTLDGSYNVPVRVSEGTNTIHSAETVAAYVVKSCVRSAPQLTISPASQSASPGTALSYTIGVTNQDSASCGSSAFALSNVLPTGLSGTLSSTLLTLTPGQQLSATLSVTSAISAPSGTYPITISAIDSSTSSHSASGNASYSVLSSSDTQAPASPQGLTGRSQRKQIALSWSATTDNVGVMGYSVFRDNVKIADTTSTSYSDKAVTNGVTYTYTVTAYDAAGNVSTPSNAVSVTKR